MKHKQNLKIKPPQVFFNLKFKKENFFVGAIFQICFFVGSLVVSFFKYFGKVLYVASFATGSVIFYITGKSTTIAKSELVNTKLSFLRRITAFRTVHFSQTVTLFFGLAMIGWCFFLSAKLVARALEVKNSVVKTAQTANSHLQKAQQELQNNNYNEANVEFSSALKNFNNTDAELKGSGEILNTLLSLFPQKRDGEKLIEAGKLISETGQKILIVSNILKNLKFTPQGIISSASTSHDLNLLFETLTESSESMQKVTSLVSGVNENNLPKNQALQLISLKQKINGLDMTLRNCISLISLTKNLLLGQKNILVVFENNNELRATGGFIGTYGNFTLHDGLIEKLKISSIYDLDGQLNENIVPPTPIRNVSDKFYMRDSNWFAAWPKSARLIGDFYEKEGGETPDLLIAVTPKLITDLLNLTGPIYLPGAGRELNSENFVEQIESISTVSYNTPLNSPKQILADFFPVILQKISELPKEQYINVFEVLLKNLNEKQLLFFSRHSNLQNEFLSYNWAGDILPTDRDSLLVASSNLGGTKTDLFIDQKLKLTTTVEQDGSLTNELNITRTNRLPKLEKTVNTSFLRVYVPLGSSLLENRGFDFKVVDNSTPKEFKVNSEVLEWEKTSVRDIVTGTIIGKESGKTFFGNWLNLNGGETKTVTLRYKLPFRLKPLDHYSLLLQKQPGDQNTNFENDINFPGKKIEWNNFLPKSLSTNSIEFSTPLNQDYFLGLILNNR